MVDNDGLFARSRGGTGVGVGGGNDSLSASIFCFNTSSREQVSWSFRSNWVEYSFALIRISRAHSHRILADSITSLILLEFTNVAIL